MCIHAGDDELDSVKALMSMSLNALVAEIFELDLDAMDPTLRLREDLLLDDAKAAALADDIADYFDGLRIDLGAVITLQDLFDRVINEEYSASLSP